MRLPIILMLLTVILLPADLHALASDVSARLEVAAATVGKVFDRNEPETTQVAELKPLPRRVPSFN